MNNRPLPIRFRKRLLRIIRDCQQIVNDIEWWNDNRLDAEPIDCEIEKVLVHMGTKAVTAYDAGDWDEHARLSREMTEVLLIDRTPNL